MKGAMIAAGLLLAVFSFALAFVPRKIAFGAALVCVLTALAAAHIGGLPSGVAFTGCWVSLALAALSVYWPRIAQGTAWLCLVFAADAGLWAGLVVSTEAPWSAMLQVLAVLLLGVPAAACIDRGWTIVPRIVTSWLLAVAILVGAIPHLVVHPGYEPDHNI
jgi:hypothetical protein